VIEIRNVSKWYGSFQVLTDCSTTISKGEVVISVACARSSQARVFKRRFSSAEPFRAGPRQ